MLHTYFGLEKAWESYESLLEGVHRMSSSCFAFGSCTVVGHQVPSHFPPEALLFPSLGCFCPISLCPLLHLSFHKPSYKTVPNLASLKFPFYYFHIQRLYHTEMEKFLPGFQDPLET